MSLLLSLTPQQRRIYTAISRAGADGLTHKELIEILYADDPGGGPPNADSSVRASLSLLTSPLRKYKLRIRTVRQKTYYMERVK